MGKIWLEFMFYGSTIFEENQIIRSREFEQDLNTHAFGFSSTVILGSNSHFSKSGEHDNH